MRMKTGEQPKAVEAAGRTQLSMVKLETPSRVSALQKFQRNFELCR